MKCKNCKNKNVMFIEKWSDNENLYKCIDCGRNIVSKPENEDIEVEV